MVKQIFTTFESKTEFLDGLPLVAMLHKDRDIMTIKDAILKSLEDIKQLTTSPEVCKHIIDNNYYDFKVTKTPENTVSAQLGGFIRNGDSRVKRIKQSNGTYSYYLTKDEPEIEISLLSEDIQSEQKNIKVTAKKSYDERDLHKLLATYLKSLKIFSKTIFHEQSTFGKDNNQTWTHPDMVGIRFLDLHSKASQNFLKAVNKVDTFKLYSYELKKEINSDSELKKAFFQAVSNSSWANFGFLVAFEFSDSLTEEMSRLNQSFGIGIIEINANPYESRILFPAKYRDLDFKTIDKLCRINSDFERFMEQSEKLLTAEERYYKSTEKELDEFCDNYFDNDSDIEIYCKEKNIPTKE